MMQAGVLEEIGNGVKSVWNWITALFCGTDGTPIEPGRKPLFGWGDGGGRTGEGSGNETRSDNVANIGNHRGPAGSGLQVKGAKGGPGGDVQASGDNNNKGNIYNANDIVTNWNDLNEEQQINVQKAVNEMSDEPEFIQFWESGECFEVKFRDIESITKEYNLGRDKTIDNVPAKSNLIWKRNILDSPVFPFGFIIKQAIRAKTVNYTKYEPNTIDFANEFFTTPNHEGLKITNENLKFLTDYGFEFLPFNTSYHHEFFHKWQSVFGIKTYLFDERDAFRFQERIFRKNHK